MDVHTLLGDAADSLLEHECKTLSLRVEAGRGMVEGPR